MSCQRNGGQLKDGDADGHDPVKMEVIQRPGSYFSSEVPSHKPH